MYMKKMYLDILIMLSWMYLDLSAFHKWHVPKNI